MKKIYLALCALAAAALLTACNNDSGGVAIVNSSQVFQECESGKQAREYMEKLAEEMQDDLRALQNAVETAPQAGREAAQRRLQETVIDYQQRLRSEEQQILNKLTEDYQSVLDEYREANKLSLILRSEVMVSTSAEADITQAIIEAMNNKAAAENAAALSTSNATAEPASSNATEPESSEEAKPANTEEPSAANATQPESNSTAE